MSLNKLNQISEMPLETGFLIRIGVGGKTNRFLKFGPCKIHFCIQVANVDLDAAVFLAATATSGVPDVDSSPNHMIELSLGGQYLWPHLWTQTPENKATDK